MPRGFDLSKIIARKKQDRQKLTLGVKAKLNGNGVTIIQGEAVIRGEEDGYILIQCGEEVFAVKNIFALYRFGNRHSTDKRDCRRLLYWTSKEALDVKELPGRLLLSVAE